MHIVKVIYHNNAASLEKHLQKILDAAPAECMLYDIKFATHTDADGDLETFSAIMIFQYAKKDIGKVQTFKTCV